MTLTDPKRKQRRTTSRWYAESSEWVQSLNSVLRIRPESGPFEPDPNNPELILEGVSEVLYRED
jgi:hypothetical protein